MSIAPRPAPRSGSATAWCGVPGFLRATVLLGAVGISGAAAATAQTGLDPDRLRAAPAPRVLVVDQTATPDGVRLFADIQSAIDAAGEADLVRVRDTGVYAGFVLTKGVVVRPAARSFRATETVSVVGVPAGSLAAVIGMDHAAVAVESPLTVFVRDCAGTIVLEDLDLRSDSATATRDAPQLSIEGCELVLGTGIVTENDLYTGFVDGGPANVSIADSTVFLCESDLSGVGGTHGDGGESGGDGTAALEVLAGSTVFLARSPVEGGFGGAGGCQYAFGECSTEPGGDGGDAVVVRGGSTVSIVGGGADAVEGGIAAEYCCFVDLCCTTPGTDGRAIDVELGSAVTVSNVPVIGDVVGDGTSLREDGLPHLSSSGPLATSRILTLTVADAEPGAGLIAVVSHAASPEVLPGFRGPPLLPDLEDSVFTVWLGQADAGGDFETSACSYFGPASFGVPFHVQCMVFGPSGVRSLTNPVSRVAGGAALDCDGNGVDDTCDILAGRALDCNGNGVPDSCDVESGVDPDCDGNDVPDSCDIASGLALDCNGNGVPDSCDLAAGTEPDCNQNGVPDSCDVASGLGTDCDGDGVLDECQLAGRDCNGNQVLDSCDIADGTSLDLDLDGIPDECGNTLRVPSGYPTIQDALLAAAPGDLILLEDGVHDGPGNRDLDLYGIGVTIRGQNGAASSILDCQGSGRALSIRNTSGFPIVVIQDLTIRNGSFSGAGGAISVTEANPTIRNCRFESCQASNGGAISLLNSAGLIENCTFVDCIATYGGAVHADGARSPRIRSSLFTDNLAVIQGSALWFGPVGGRIAGCTIAGNATLSGTGPALMLVDTDVTVDSCILWNNSSTFEDLGAIESGFARVWNCDVAGGLPDPALDRGGNFELDPRFQDLPSRDFHLLPDSPCIDAGYPAYVPGPWETDLDGDPRIQGTAVDVGIDEF